MGIASREAVGRTGVRVGLCVLALAACAFVSATFGMNQALETSAEIQQLEPGLIHWMERHLADRTVLFVIIMVAFGTLVSEDLTCVAVGILVAEGALKLPVAIIACFIGILGGDVAIYLCGHHFGDAVVTRFPLRCLITPDRLKASKAWFRKRGGIVVLLGRFVPGSRMPTYLAAGILRLGVWRFVSFAAVATALWVPLLTGLAAKLGRPVIGWLARYNTAVTAVAIGGLIVWLALKLLTPQFSFKGRRLFIGKLRRIRNFEFWPSWVFYIPIVLYGVTVLARRHKGLTVFALVNPGIPMSGLIGESKADVLDALGGGGEWIARYALLRLNDPLEVRVDAYRAFVRDNGLAYPVILKPDRGQRGFGIRVVRNEAEALSVVAAQSYDLMAQQFVDGEEYGVFYYRYPQEAAGRIFSLTEKHLPFVVGDGQRTLEELVLRDDRAVSRAEFYLAQDPARRYEVIPAGVHVTLVQVCNHCCGATFYNATDLVTPELERAIDVLSKRHEGFFLGRYDIRTPNVDDFFKGRNFKIIELNGVSGEATHVWHPGARIRTAYRDIAHQWRVAYEIGALNRDRLGLTPPTPREVMRTIRDYYSA